MSLNPETRYELDGSHLFNLKLYSGYIVILLIKSAVCITLWLGNLAFSFLFLISITTLLHIIVLYACNLS